MSRIPGTRICQTRKHVVCSWIGRCMGPNVKVYSMVDQNCRWGPIYKVQRKQDWVIFPMFSYVCTFNSVEDVSKRISTDFSNTRTLLWQPNLATLHCSGSAVSTHLVPRTEGTHSQTWQSSVQQHWECVKRINLRLEAHFKTWPYKFSF